MTKPAMALSVAIVTIFLLAGRSEAQDALPRDVADAALQKAVVFFRTHVSTEGGYLWRYSGDLKFQEGETVASRTTIWVQPPGTPTVGQAYLDCYELTGDQSFLQAAREAAGALVRGQLASGGWDYRIEFDPAERVKYAYRADVLAQTPPLSPRQLAKQRNVTTLDDNTTQSAIQFLMRIDRMLEFRDGPIHNCAVSALDSLIAVQYPNGAWPQRFSAEPDHATFPVLRASYPDSWSREHDGADYRQYYTFNDSSITDTMRTMLEASQVYSEERYRQAAERAGDFILLAQMPEPQPAWAQQYDASMHPAWARKFEPPAITGGESQGILRALIDLYRWTGKSQYLEPVPRAVEYLKSSELADGQLARFYELATNRPLYFTKQYQLTYDDSDLPTHYSFKVSSKRNSIESAYQRARTRGPDLLDADIKPLKAKASPKLTAAATKIVESQSPDGSWMRPGRLKSASDAGATGMIIETETFAENIRVLAEFVAVSVPKSQ